MAAALSQAQLGESLGLKEPNTAAPRISRYETGLHEPDAATAKRLAKALSVPVPYLHANSNMMAELILAFSQLDTQNKKVILSQVKALVNNGVRHPYKKR